MTTGRLTTHVLDTARGCPASGVAIRLFRIDGDARVEVARTVTNADGRTDAPLMADPAPGVYEIEFAAGDYLRATGQVTAGQAGEGILFLDLIPIRFGIATAGQHHHVPLLLSPFAYSTYRGS